VYQHCVSLRENLIPNLTPAHAPIIKTFIVHHRHSLYYYSSY
jgi:hypothetical protein